MAEAELIGATIIALGTIIGLFVTVAKPMISLKGTIEQLKMSIDMLNDKIKEQSSTLTDHEKRISKLEQHDVRDDVIIKEHDNILKGLQGR